jgi:hypothetical protein
MFENSGNLLSPSWRILDISEGQFTKRKILSQNIDMKKNISMRFLAFSIYGIFGFIFYRESPQETSKYKRKSQFRLCVQKHIG